MSGVLTSAGLHQVGGDLFRVGLAQNGTPDAWWAWMQQNVATLTPAGGLPDYLLPAAQVTLAVPTYDGTQPGGLPAQ